MYIYTPLCRHWIAPYRHVLVFIVPHVDIELEDNKQFIWNIPRIKSQVLFKLIVAENRLTQKFLFIYLFIYLHLYLSIVCMYVSFKWKNLPYIK